MLSRFLKDGSENQEILGAHAEFVKSSDLKDLLPHGFGIHHAGLARVDRQLIEKLFAEKHIQNVREACSWLGYTYLYIRMLRNPTLYGLSADIMETDKTLDKRRVDLVHSAANLLDRNNLIKLDEKMELAKLIDRVPIPVKESLAEPSAKINVLLQAYISRLKLEGLSLSSDMVYIRQNAGRLVHALFEIVLKRGWAQLAEKALNLSDFQWDDKLHGYVEPFWLIVEDNGYLHEGLNDLDQELVTQLFLGGRIQKTSNMPWILTWSFMYRQLTKNPNYYNLQGVSHRHLSEHLSELVETVLNDLESTNCLAIEENMYLKTLNLGLIASYYYVSYTTIERFSSMLTQKTKMKGLLEILAFASEYAELPSRSGEEESIKWLVRHQRFSIEKARYDNPHVKANTLLQCHFSRRTVRGDLAADQREILLSAPRLLQAMVDVASSNGWLTLALNAMELSQMVIQGMWDRDPVLLQLPHFTEELARRCQENEGKAIESIFDLAELSTHEM
ncbi:hypothetical protein E2562_031124 [Oryza meyeriana var. granulata]|uniref:SEC63 domain-containing protein n=1 Tax=Oryza meyeriana var. granulata TaxID=110450 RepID=A0A6G1DQJ1_9ORYZ|nr:hypothetical protein E2562_031124 [Oryza meyeriana var. granulata]